MSQLIFRLQLGTWVTGLVFFAWGILDQIYGVLVNRFEPWLNVVLLFIALIILSGWLIQCPLLSKKYDKS